MRSLFLGRTDMKTYSAKPNAVKQDWYIVDAEGKTLGRLAAEVAHRLRGKHKPEYTPHVDTGDFIIVINADKVQVEGKRLDKKSYVSHSGYPGNLKRRSFKEYKAEHPEFIIEHAVRLMLPKSKLGRSMYKKLKVYAGENHPHQDQQPQVLDIK